VSRRWRRALTPPRALAATVAALAAGVAAVAAIPPVTEEPVLPTGREEPLAGLSLVCPLLGGEPQATDSVSALALPDMPAGPLLRDSQPLQVRALAGAGNVTRVDLTVAQRGRPATTTVESGVEHSYEATARGPLAPGVVVEQGRLAAGEQTVGLADTGCPPPGRDFWFVGGSSLTGARTRLVLANPATSAALLEVTAYDESGEVATPALEDVLVAPRTSTVVRLDALATGSARLAFRVRVDRGQVLAAADLRLVQGLDPLGLTWIPSAAVPARQLVVPAVPATGDRALQILNPGQEDAVVSFRVLGLRGEFAATGLPPLTVRAGSVGEVDLSAARVAEPAAVALAADTPVTAAVRVRQPEPQRGGLPDIAVTAAATPLTGVTATALRSEGDVATSLSLTAPGDEPGRVRVQVLDAAGAELSSTTHDVAAGRTAVLPVGVPRAGRAPYAIVVTPLGPGPILASRVARGTVDAPAPLSGSRVGALLDVVPLAAPLVTVTVPAVGPELAAH
jgi:hypothetical protein